jgi:exopolysaccharide biosynthesis polyprenyl glycosylphosphotransferase
MYFGRYSEQLINLYQGIILVNHHRTKNEVQESSVERNGRNTETLRYQIYFLLLMGDLAVLLLSFAAASMIRFGGPLPPGWLGLVGVVTAFYVLGAFSWGAYSLEAVTSASVGIKRSLASLCGSFGLLFLTFYFLKVGPDFSRAMSLMSLVISAGLLLLMRSLISNWVKRKYGQKLIRQIFIVDGEQELSLPVLHAHETVVASCPKPSELEPLMELSQLIAGADRVIVSCSRKSADRWADVLRWSGVQGEILLPNFEALYPIGIAKFNDQPTLIISSGSLDASQRFLKRLLDLVVASSLILILAPLFLLIAILIKLDSPGPILFRQLRIGQGNVIFQIHKFRTMGDEDTDVEGEASTLRDDPRITKIGNLLRKTSLDELPQLMNVLIGNMSIVGPRPHALGSTAEDELFWEVDEKYWYRHALKPGITGLAQIRGYRGATKTKKHLRQRVRADLEYMQGWSIGRDIAIIAKTAMVLVHPNAY